MEYPAVSALDITCIEDDSVPPHVPVFIRLLPTRPAQCSDPISGVGLPNRRVRLA